jgi:hypothetical protein
MRDRWWHRAGTGEQNLVSDLSDSELSEYERRVRIGLVNYTGDYTLEGALLRIDIERIRRARGW